MQISNSKMSCLTARPVLKTHDVEKAKLKYDLAIKDQEITRRDDLIEKLLAKLNTYKADNKRLYDVVDHMKNAQSRNKQLQAEYQPGSS